MSYYLRDLLNITRGGGIHTTSIEANSIRANTANLRVDVSTDDLTANTATFSQLTVGNATTAGGNGGFTAQRVITSNISSLSGTVNIEGFLKNSYLQRSYTNQAMQTHYSAEILRGTGASGLLTLRSYRDPTAYPGDRDVIVRKPAGPAQTIHNHPEYKAMVGLAEVTAIINGFYVRTQHQDPKLLDASDQYLEAPTLLDLRPAIAGLPTGVSLNNTTSVNVFDVSSNTQAKYMQNFYKDSVADARLDMLYFELWLEDASASDALTSAQQSFRHEDLATSMNDALKRILQQTTPGLKDQSENVSFKSGFTAFIGDDGKPVFCAINFRIRAVTVGSMAQRTRRITWNPTVDVPPDFQVQTVSADVGGTHGHDLLTLSPEDITYLFEDVDNKVYVETSYNRGHAHLEEVSWNGTRFVVVDIGDRDGTEPADPNGDTHTFDLNSTGYAPTITSYRNANGIVVTKPVTLTIARPPSHVHPVTTVLLDPRYPFDVYKAANHILDSTNRFMLIKDEETLAPGETWVDLAISTRARFALERGDYNTMCQSAWGLDGVNAPALYDITATDSQTYASSTSSTRLNMARYNRSFALPQKDASGRSTQYRGFNDPNLFVARTSKPTVVGGYSYMIPLELVVRTPHELWNPYNIQILGEGTTQTGNGKKNTPYAAARAKNFWYLLPAGLFEKSVATDAADTVTSTAIWVKSKPEVGGRAYPVTNSGMFIFRTGVTEYKDLAGNVITKDFRQRFPIAPCYHESTPAAVRLRTFQKNMDAARSDVELLKDACKASSAETELALSKWIISASAQVVEWADVLWIDNTFVALGSQGNVATSPDGQAWTQRRATDTFTWTSMAVSKTLIVAVSTQGRVMTSADKGTSWTLQDTSFNKQWGAVIWVPLWNLFIACASVSTQTPFMTSSNGVDWTLRSGVSSPFTCLAYAPSLQLAVAVSSSSGKAVFSKDGKEWSIVACPSMVWSSVAWSPALSRFVAVARGGTGGRVMWSRDGQVWTQVAVAPQFSWKSVEWSDDFGVFVAVASTGELMTSSTGLDWTLRSLPLPTGTWATIAWSPELAMFLALSSTGGLVLSSPLVLPTSKTTLHAMESEVIYDRPTKTLKVIDGTVEAKTVRVQTLEISKNPGTSEGGGGLGLVGSVGIRTDVLTGGVIDGDLFQFNGAMYGNGSGLTGFSEKTNASMESRLSSFSNSARRLYVSTTGSDANHGKSRDKALRTIKKAASMARALTVIWVEAGTYTEDNPIYVPPNVTIIGDSLRNTILLAANSRLDYFHLTNMNYISQLRFVDLRAPGFCCAFPCSLAAVNIASIDFGLSNPTGEVVSQEEDGATQRVPVLYSPEAPNGYYNEDLPPGPDPEAPVQALLTALAAGIHGYVCGNECEPGDLGFGGAAKSNNGGYRRAAVYLRAHVAFFQAEIMASQYVNGLTDPQKTKCRRDVGYLVEAFATDLTNGGYVASLDAALKYSKGTTSVLSSGTKKKTADAITQLGVLCTYVAVGAAVPVGERTQTSIQQSGFDFTGTEEMVSVEEGIDTAVDRVKALVEITARIIDNGLADAVTNMDGGGSLVGERVRSVARTPGTARAARALKASVEALQFGTLAFMEKNATLSEAEKNTCVRGVAYILDAICFDLLNGSYMKTREYAGVYVDNSVLSLAAIRNVGDLAAAIITNTTKPSNVFDKNIETSFESLLQYPTYGGTRDAVVVEGNTERPLVTIGLTLPGPTMYIAYRLRRTNLIKWKLQARETPTAPWDTIGVEAITQQSVAEEGVDDDARDAVTYAQALCQGIADIIVNRTASFPPEASLNPGGFTRQAALLFKNTQFIQAEIMAWVAGLTGFELDQVKKDLCKRDVGLIVAAIAGDLRTGGFGKSMEAARAYYNGTTTKLSTPGTIAPTADAVRRIGLFTEGVLTNTPVASSLRKQVVEKQQYDEGSRTVPTYETTAVKGYCFYRLVMLQTGDSSTFKLGSIEFLDMQLPEIVVDGPNDVNMDVVVPGTVIRGFEIADGGDGYSSNATVTITPKVEGARVGELAVAKAVIVGGKVSDILLEPRTYDSVQSLTLTYGGKGYVTAPTVTVAVGNNRSAKARAWIDAVGSVVRLELVDGGSGYTGTPTVTFSAPPAGGVSATATASIQGSSEPGFEWSLLRGRGYVGGAKVEVTGGTRAAQISVVMMDDFAEMRAPVYDTFDTLNVNGKGRLQSLRILHRGSGYSTAIGVPPTVSIPPPDSIKKINVITGSPYVQNCSNLSGPFDTTGEKIPVTWRLPWKQKNVYNASSGDDYESARTSDESKGVRKMDNNGAGGGIRIDGRCCADLSPLRSFVVDAFTQLCQGGIGFLLLGQSYAQFVSTFGTFCSIHALATGGSFANFSNSVTDFGRRGLIAQGYARDPYLTGQVKPPLIVTGTTQNGDFYNANFVNNPGGTSFYASKVSELVLDKEGKGYVADPAVTIDPPPENLAQGQKPALGRARVKPVVNPGDPVGTLLKPEITESGAGYKYPPAVTIAPPTGSYTGETTGLQRAEATAKLAGVSTVRVQITGGAALRFVNNPKPDTGSIVRIHGVFYTVSGATKVGENEYDIAFGGEAGAPPYVDVGHAVEFFFVSTISTGGHVFEYCGDDTNGCTYNALPEYGGNYSEDNQIKAIKPAMIFYTSSDHTGKQKIGKFFVVDQANGSVTLDASKFNLKKITSLGPFVRNNVPQGTSMEEISPSDKLTSSLGFPDDNAVPTQKAVKTYVDARAVPAVQQGQGGRVLRINESATEYGWSQLTVETLGKVNVNLRTDVITGLVVDGDALVFGNVACDTLLASRGARISQTGTDGNVRTMSFDIRSDSTVVLTVVNEAQGTSKSTTLTLA